MLINLGFLDKVRVKEMILLDKEPNCQDLSNDDAMFVAAVEIIPDSIYLYGCRKQEDVEQIKSFSQDVQWYQTKVAV